MISNSRRVTGEGGGAAVRGAFMGAQIKIEWKDVGEVSKVIPGRRVGYPE